MARNIRTVILIIIGVISIGLSIRCFSFKELSSEPKSMYGGDAFTGIQNAGAQTSENVMELAKIVQFGFGSVLLVAGLGFLGVGLTSPMTKKSEDEEQEPEAETGGEESLDPVEVSDNTPSETQTTDNDKAE